MDIKAKILEHLANTGREFHDSLIYAMKLWKSPSFYYMSKYDITFNYFLQNVFQYFEHAQAKYDEATFNERWQTVNSFLLLPCPSNALPAPVMKKVEKCLVQLCRHAKDRKEQLLETFLIVAFDAKYKNFYKFDYQLYGSVLSAGLLYYKKCLEIREVPKEDEEKLVDRIFADIQIYSKSAAGTAKWMKAFDSFLVPLSEVVLLLEKRGIKRRDELLDLLKQLYFTPENVSKYNRVPDGQPFMGSFEVQLIPLHVIAVLMEGFIRTYRDLKLEILLFLKYFLQNVFVTSSRSLLKDSHQMYALTKYVFRLLKKYFVILDQELMVDFDFTTMLTDRLKQQLKACIGSEPMLCDFFDLICTINEYNPLVLEHSIVDIILSVMFLRKGSDTLRSYQTMLISTVAMFMKLNKSENLCDELFMKLNDYLEENDMDDVIANLRTQESSEPGKRKIEKESEISAKKIKLTDGAAQSTITVPMMESKYWDVLFAEGEKSDEERRRLQRHRPVVHNCWPEITFAWPDADGRLSATMKEYSKQLLTKRSITYWKNFMVLLSDFIVPAEDEPSEGTIFQLELALCWMCYFFAGNTLIEHSNLFWARLVNCIEEFDQLMGAIGRKIISAKEGSPERKLYGAFLNVIYYYGNYRMMVFYYRPDSIEESNYDQLYGYLTDSEWQAIEQYVPERDTPLLNRVLVQKLRLSYLKQEKQPTEEDASVCEERRQMIERLLRDKSGEHLRPLLLDRSTNVWLLGLMNKEQQRHAVYRLLDPAYCPLEDIQYLLAEVASDHELLEVFLLGAYRKVTELLVASGKAATLGKLPVETLFEQDEEAIVPKLRKLLLKQSVTDQDEEKAQLPEAIGCALEHILNVLDEIRIDSIEQGKKSLLVAVHLLLLVHLNASNAEKAAERFKAHLIKFILLGTSTNMSRFIMVETLFERFGKSPIVIILLQQLLEHLTEPTFEELRSVLNNFSPEKATHFELLLLIYNLEHRNKSRYRYGAVPAARRAAFLGDIVIAIDKYLLQQDSRKQRKKDVVGFNHAIKACQTSIRHKAEQQEELDEKLREHILGYVQQAMKVFTYNSDMLLTGCLFHKDLLQLDPAMVAEIEQKCWQTFITLMQERTAAKESHEHHGMALNEENPSVSKSEEQLRRIGTIITALVGHFSEQQYVEKLNLLNRIEFTSGVDSSSSTSSPLKTTMAIFSILSKNGLPNTVTQEVCKVFVRSFASVVARDVMGLCVLNQHRRDPELLYTILECFETIIGNGKLALFPALLDYVLQFLSAINIAKQASVQAGEESAFFRLHRTMGGVMFVLLRARSKYVASRLPSYMHVYEGLVGALISYKGVEGIGKSLTSFEILTISDLMLPLQRIVNIACKKLQKQLYILAPYVLGQILHTIVQCKRATTEHNRIASNVHNVCFSLIAICDPHVPSYLLRTMDEGSRLLFTDIKKRYERRMERGTSKGKGKSN
uniref:Urb2 domain-containing protein n=1 Tax=Anopheles epiroticus TaxID=199890 RepID=A0A182PKW4_9DIPT